MELYFDGYCPESLLKGKQVEMRLNEDDFWESEATGLQVAVFPPFATILRWRGRGKLRQSPVVASNSFSGLLITETQLEDGKEILPDEGKIITNDFDLEWYLDTIYASKEEFDAAKFNPHDPVFEKQRQYIRSISKEEIQTLVQLFDSLKEEANQDEFYNKESFEQLHKKLYDLKLIFDFRWMAWHEGWKNINHSNFDFSNCSLLDISMYLTAIFREDGFSEGTIKKYFKNGTLDKIFNRLQAYSSENP